MNRFRFVVMVILAGLFAGLLSGCSTVSGSEKKEIVQFYTGFVKEATSLDSAQINKVYSDLKGQDFSGQSSSNVRAKMFAEFDKINPDFFSKLHLTDSTYAEVGKTYSTILRLSLAADSIDGVEVTMPSDAVTAYKDDKLGRMVYEIDRTKITAVVSEEMGRKITRPNRNGLAPVRIIKDGDSWKVLADNNMLSEVGVPLDENISAPSTDK